MHGRVPLYCVQFLSCVSLTLSLSLSLIAVVWQLMRAYTLSVLQKLAKSDKPISDAEIVAWANEALAAAGKSSHIASFKV